MAGAENRFTVTKATEEEPIGELGRKEGYGAASVQYTGREPKGENTTILYYLSCCRSKNIIILCIGACYMNLCTSWYMYNDCVTTGTCSKNLYVLIY